MNNITHVHRQALEAPGALDAPCAVSYGPVPADADAQTRLLGMLGRRPVAAISQQA